MVVIRRNGGATTATRIRPVTNMAAADATMMPDNTMTRENVRGRFLSPPIAVALKNQPPIAASSRYERPDAIDPYSLLNASEFKPTRPVSTSVWYRTPGSNGPVRAYATKENDAITPTTGSHFRQDVWRQGRASWMPSTQSL